MAIYLGITHDGALISSDGYILQDTNGMTLYALQTSAQYKIIMDNVVYRVNVLLSLKDGE